MNTIGQSVSRHALGWLFAGNLVGVVLSALVVWPALNSVLAPFSYGRWMPLHLDWQLYGWSALPLLGLLLVWFLDSRDLAAVWLGQLALRTWSAALLVGGATWLAGMSSGKLFLEWSGWARPLLPAAMVLAWTVLAWALGRRWPVLSTGGKIARGLALLFLLPVPLVLHHALSPAVFPAVNPDSGGATGTTLLGSTLGILAIGALVPWLLEIPSVPKRRIRLGCAAWFVLSAGLFVAADHGSVSHHHIFQVAALGSVLPWSALAPAYFQTFAWPASARPWLVWAAVWWVALMITGWLSFLPGVSEQIKFTNVFVAHGHLAIAGLVTSMHGAILTVLGGPLGTSVRLIRLWQLAGLAHIVVLTAIGGIEVYSSSEYFINRDPVPMLFGLRLVAGFWMLVPTVIWWWRSLR